MVTHRPLHGQPPPALTTPNLVYKRVFMYMQPLQPSTQQPQDMMEVVVVQYQGGQRLSLLQA